MGGGEGKEGVLLNAECAKRNVDMKLSAAATRNVHTHSLKHAIVHSFPGYCGQIYLKQFCNSLR